MDLVREFYCGHNLSPHFLPKVMSGSPKPSERDFQEGHYKLAVCSLQLGDRTQVPYAGREFCTAYGIGIEVPCDISLSSQ